MQNTTADYKIEINKPSRSFECKITIGNNIYTNEDLVNLTLEFTQPQEGFSIGGTISKSLDLTLLNRGDIIYSTSQIKVEIGLKIGSKIEYILMGLFNIDDIEKTDYTTKFTAYDNMIKFETDYFSELGDKPTLQQVVNELSSKTGVEFTGSLPTYTVSKLDGFSCREVLSYVASICCGNALITRDGKFTIKTLGEVEKSIDGSNYFNYTREEVKYKVGQISCQVDENNILSKGSIGTDSMELGFENPWVTENILNDLYNKLNGLSYLGYSMKWQGDISLDPYDIITVTDVKNVVRKIPILSQKITYTGGLTSEIGAKGETKNKNSFSSSGSTTNKVNRAVIEQAIIKEALIEKANIKDVEAVSIRTQTLEAKTAKIEEAIIDVAHIKDLNAINANIQNLIAADATINNALINKADITELNAVKGTINSLDSKIANIETLVNGNLSSENIQAGGITSDKLTIANGFITNAMIANLDVSKINAGDFSTNKFRIVSDSGKMLIADNTIQIRDNNRVRVQIGKDASNDYSMYVWDSAGKLMFDATGLKADGIKNKIIRDDMISDNANIAGSKINISSLVTEINKDTNTTVIKSGKVQIDSLKQTLDVAFNSLKTQADSTKSLTESHSTTIGAMQGKITTAINNTQIVKDGQTILLKDDYNRTVAKVDSINSTIGAHTTKLDQLTGSITSVDTKVNSIERDLEGTKSTVSSHTSQINGLNSKVSTQGSSISQLQNQISLKVEATDVTNAIKNVQVGVRNLVKNSPTLNNSFGQLGTFRGTRTILDDASAKSGKVIKIECTTAGIGFYCNLWSGDDSCIGKKYTWSFHAKMNKDKTLNNIGHERGGGTTIAVTTEWKKFTYTWTYSSTGSRSVVFYPNFAVGDIFYIKDFKIEEGDKATDWTPAPEDIDSSISTVDGKITTTSNKVATIEINLGSITQRVSSTESTVNATSNKVAAIETNLSSITSRVSSTESTVTTINGNVTSLQSRMTTAEQKITPTAITTTISSTISGGTGSISTTQFVMDKNGLTINNGALIIKNKAGKTVLSSDSNGNLLYTGALYAQVDSSHYAKIEPILTNNNKDVKLRLSLVGNTEHSNFDVVNAAGKELFRVGHGGVELNNNVTFKTDQEGDYNGNCYWENGTYYPANDWKNIIGKNSNAFYKVFGYKFGLDRTGSERYADFEGPIFRLISSWGYGGLAGDMKGYFFPEENNAWSFGKSDKRISTVYCTNINQPSDLKLKENVKYLLRDEVQTLSLEQEGNNSDITTQDCYDFIKNDLKLAQFNYKLSQEKENEKIETIGFIAQDIEDTKIGDILLSKDENNILSYDNATYMGILASALQKAIDKIESLENRIKVLESKGA